MLHPREEEELRSHMRFMRHHRAAFEEWLEDRRRPGPAVDWFNYVFQVPNPFTLAAGATSIVNKPTDAEAAFGLQKLQFYAELNGVASPPLDNIWPDVSIQIQDQTNSKNLFDLPCPIGSICGNGKLPYILPFERIFAAKTSIVVTFNNFSAIGRGAGAVQYDNVTLVMSGRKIWPR